MSEVGGNMGQSGRLLIGFVALVIVLLATEAVGGGGSAGDTAEDPGVAASSGAAETSGADDGTHPHEGTQSPGPGGDGATSSGELSESPSPTEPYSPPPTAQAAQDFTVRLSAALAEVDVELLLDMLHPVVYDFYTREQCAEYLRAVVPNELPVAFRRDRGKVFGYEYGTPTGKVEVSDVIAVEIERTADGETLVERTHYGFVGDDLRWFAICESGS